VVGIDGTTNAVVFEADPVGRVTITGPGAGPQLAGLGVLSESSRSRAAGPEAYSGDATSGSRTYGLLCPAAGQ